MGEHKLRKEPTDEEILQAALSQLPPLTPEQDQQVRWMREFCQIVMDTKDDPVAFNLAFEQFAARLGVSREELARMREAAGGPPPGAATGFSTGITGNLAKVKQDYAKKTAQSPPFYSVLLLIHLHSASAFFLRSQLTSS